jgi:hypothetical protein
MHTYCSRILLSLIISLFIVDSYAMQPGASKTREQVFQSMVLSLVANESLPHEKRLAQLQSLGANYSKNQYNGMQDYYTLLCVYKAVLQGNISTAVQLFQHEIQAALNNAEIKGPLLAVLISGLNAKLGVTATFKERVDLVAPYISHVIALPAQELTSGMADILCHYVYAVTYSRDTWAAQLRAENSYKQCFASLAGMGKEHMGYQAMGKLGIAAIGRHTPNVKLAAGLKQFNPQVAATGPELVNEFYDRNLTVDRAGLLLDLFVNPWLVTNELPDGFNREQWARKYLLRETDQYGKITGMNQIAHWAARQINPRAHALSAREERLLSLIETIAGKNDGLTSRYLRAAVGFYRSDFGRVIDELDSAKRTDTMFVQECVPFLLKAYIAQAANRSLSSLEQEQCLQKAQNLVASVEKQYQKNNVGLQRLYYMAGKTFFENNFTQEALNVFSKSDDVSSQFERARILYNMRQYSDLTGCCDRLMRNNSNKILNDKERVSFALMHLEAAAHDPQLNQKTRTKKLQSIFVAHGMALKNLPDCWSDYATAYAWYAYLQGDYQNALDAVREVAQLSDIGNKILQKAHTIGSLCCLAQNKRADASEHLDRAVDLVKDGEPFYQLMALQAAADKAYRNKLPIDQFVEFSRTIKRSSNPVSYDALMRTHCINCFDKGDFQNIVSELGNYIDEHRDVSRELRACYAAAQVATGRFDQDLLEDLAMQTNYEALSAMLSYFKARLLHELHDEKKALAAYKLVAAGNSPYAAEAKAYMALLYAFNANLSNKNQSSIADLVDHVLENGSGRAQAVARFVRYITSQDPASRKEDFAALWRQRELLQSAQHYNYIVLDRASMLAESNQDGQAAQLLATMRNDDNADNKKRAAFIKAALALKNNKVDEAESLLQGYQELAELSEGYIGRSIHALLSLVNAKKGDKNAIEDCKRHLNNGQQLLGVAYAALLKFGNRIPALQSHIFVQEMVQKSQSGEKFSIPHDTSKRSMGALLEYVQAAVGRSEGTPHIQALLAALNRSQSLMTGGDQKCLAQCTAKAKELQRCQEFSERLEEDSKKPLSSFAVDQGQWQDAAGKIRDRRLALVRQERASRSNKQISAQ